MTRRATRARAAVARSASVRIVAESLARRADQRSMERDRRRIRRRRNGQEARRLSHPRGRRAAGARRARVYVGAIWTSGATERARARAQDVHSNERETLDVAAAFVAIGHAPNTGVFTQLQTTPEGYLVPARDEKCVRSRESCSLLAVTARPSSSQVRDEARVQARAAARRLRGGRRCGLGVPPGDHFRRLRRDGGARRREVPLRERARIG